MMQCEVFPEKTLGTEFPDYSGASSTHSFDFSELVKTHWGQVFRICRRITQNEHDAEDAAQDCFLRAFSHLDQFQGKAQISTWLYSIARNCSLMLLRKRRTRQELPFENSPDSNGVLPSIDPVDSGPDQLSRVLYAESSGRLVKSIASLPVTLRTAAELFILNERPLQEVAQTLKISQASAKSRLFRARRRLSRFSKRRFSAPMAATTSGNSKTARSAAA